MAASASPTAPSTATPEAPRVLLVGHGGMGRLYAEALRARGALAGVVVGREASAARLRTLIAEPVGTSLPRLLDEQRPQALAVLTPTDSHARFVRAAIARGLPSLVIKPACVRPDTAEALLVESRAAAAPVMVAHEGVYQPAFLALERAVLDGSIGAVREIQWVKEGEDSLSGGRQREPEKPEDLAGTNLAYLYATTMHELYAANRLAGRRAPITVELGELFASARTPRLDARIGYPGGLTARLRYHVGPGLPFRRGLHVVGERGSLLWLSETGKTTLRLRRGQQTRDLPSVGYAGSNPATPVIAELLRTLTARSDESPRSSDDLADGAHALAAARLLTRSAADRLGVHLDLDAVAGGADR